MKDTLLLLFFSLSLFLFVCFLFGGNTRGTVADVDNNYMSHVVF